jgi:hypothetical protein
VPPVWQEIPKDKAQSHLLQRQLPGTRLAVADIRSAGRGGLNALAEELQALLSALGRKSTAPDLRWLGRYLARLAGRKEPWSRSHLLGILRHYEHVNGGLELRTAIRAALAISEDGVRPVQATHRDQAVLVPIWLDVGGALVGTSARACAEPGCALSFIPNHPNRKYCYACRPAKLPT